MRFSEFVRMDEVDYCEGLSINVDFFWKPGTDLSFLTTGRSAALTDVVTQAVQAANMKVFDKRLTKYGANPEFGFTYLVVLGQSHIVIHTWPEKQMMNVDVFTCGSEGDPQKAVDYLVRTLRPDHLRKNQFQRGVRADIDNTAEQPDRPQDINRVPANKT